MHNDKKKKKKHFQASTRISHLPLLKNNQTSQNLFIWSTTNSVRALTCSLLYNFGTSTWTEVPNPRVNYFWQLCQLISYLYEPKDRPAFFFISPCHKGFINQDKASIWLPRQPSVPKGSLSVRNLSDYLMTATLTWNIIGIVSLPSALPPPYSERTVPLWEAKGLWLVDPFTSSVLSPTPPFSPSSSIWLHHNASAKTWFSMHRFYLWNFSWHQLYPCLWQSKFIHSRIWALGRGGSFSFLLTVFRWWRFGFMLSLLSSDRQLCFTLIDI